MHRLLENNEALSRKENGNGRRPAASWHRIDGEGPQHTPLIEAFRSLRKSILLSTADRPPSTLLVSSTQPGEGKTTSPAICHCSRAVGQESYRGCGLRSPSCTDYSERREPGFVSCLAGHQDWPYRCTSLGIAWPRSPVLRAYTSKSVGTTLFSKHGALIRSAREKYEFIILDSRPCWRWRTAAFRHTGKWRATGGEERNDTPQQVKQTLSGIRSVGANVCRVALTAWISTPCYYNYTADGLPGGFPRRRFPEVDSQGTLQQ